MPGRGLKSARVGVGQALSVVLATTGLALALAGPASADFGFSSFRATYNDSAGSTATQAGSHANMTVAFTTNTTTINGGSLTTTDEMLKDIQVDLPAGFYGNPKVAAHCSVGELLAHDGFCNPAAQVGTIDIQTTPGGFTYPFGIYNMETPSDQTAVLAADVVGAVVKIVVSVRPDGNAGLRATVSNINQGIGIFTTKVTLWGVPADPINNAQRWAALLSGGLSAGVPAQPFLSLPARCDPFTTVLRADSWQHPGRWVTETATTQLSGCDRLQFAPTVTARPEVTTPNSPSAYDVDVNVPQDQSVLGLATPQLRKATVTFPPGVAISPASASGLGACTDAQLALGTDTEPSCPNSSKIGTVSVTTPVLDDPLTGELILGTPHPDQLFRLFIVVRGSGVLLKLPGIATPDEQTGQLTTTFDTTPQLPFSVLHVRLKGGPRSPLSNPATCGPKTTTGTLDSWAGSSAPISDVFTIAGSDCARTFAPAFDAGTVDPSAGKSSSFTLTFSRSDRDQTLSGLATDLPAGLLGRVSSVPVLCAESDAAAGTCPADSRLGTTTTSAGSGSLPFSLQGGVYLTGPYKGGPFGLSIAVPAIAGPFDLGMVVVRASIQVDPNTAALRVVSDPLPTILRGIPLNIRTVNVTVDRPGFMINPTSCAAKQIAAQISSTAGDVAPVASRFQSTGCASLGYKPKLAMSLTGKGQTTDNKHPALVAHLTPRANDANTKKATVTLPISMALDPDNANALCEPLAAAADACPATSIVGHVKAVSVLHEPLQGPVYFVRGERKDPKSGRTIKTLPKLYIPLTGEGVKFNVNASSEVPDGKHLVTTFDNLPDVPLSSFDLTVDGGKHGILVVSGANLCAGRQVAVADFFGQNGKLSSSDIQVGTPCPLSVKSAGHTASAAKLTVGGISAGKVTVSGAGLAKETRTITSATVATVQSKLSAVSKRALASGRDVRVRVTVAFTPRGASKAQRVTKSLTIRR